MGINIKSDVLSIIIIIIVIYTGGIESIKRIASQILL